MFILEHFFSSTGVHDFISFFNLKSDERGGGGDESSTLGQKGVRFLLGGFKGDVLAFGPKLGWGVSNALF